MNIIKLLLILNLLFSAPLLAAQLTKEIAAERAQQQFPGRVLSIKKSNKGYDVKILNKNGQIKIIKIKR